MKTRLLLVGFCLVIVLFQARATRAQNWALAVNAPSNNWYSLATSADGTKLVAGVFGGGVYVSADSGASWSLTNLPIGSWYSSASSTNGSTLVVGAFSSIYVSTNSGSTWTSTAPNLSSVNCVSVASSGDGTKLLALPQTTS